MIAKMSHYDTAILISGDSDFLPVVGYLKDNLKYVYQFSLAERRATIDTISISLGLED